MNLFFIKKSGCGIGRFCNHWLLIFTIGFSLATQSYAVELQWRVANRFRLLSPAAQLPQPYLQWDADPFFAEPVADPDQSVWPGHTDHAYDPGTRKYFPTFVRPVEWTIQVKVTGSELTSRCTYQVSVNESKLAAVSNDGSAGACSKWTAIRAQSADFTIKADITVDSESANLSKEQSQQVSERIKIHDVLIVGLGDSYASGEGNPDISKGGGYSRIGFSYYGRDDSLTWKVPQCKYGEIGDDPRCWEISSKALWFDEICHRSLLSWQALSAWKLAQVHQDISVTFVSFACSGAKIDEGLLSVQQRMSPSGETHLIESQLRQMAELLCLPNSSSSATTKLEENTSFSLPHCAGDGKSRLPDAILLSIGGNDVGFAGLLQATLLKTYSKEKDGSLNWDWVDRDVNKITRNTARDIASIEPQLEKLAAAFERLGIDPKVVIYASYINPSHKNLNTYCVDPPSNSNYYFQPKLYTPSDFKEVLGTAALSAISLPKLKNPLTLNSQEVAGLHAAVVVPLTDRIEKDANRHKWQFVRMHAFNSKSVVPAYFIPGYCVAPNSSGHGARAFLVSADSRAIQGDVDGTLHPNKAGHLAYVRRVYPVLSKQIISSGVPE